MAGKNVFTESSRSGGRAIYGGLCLSTAGLWPSYGVTGWKDRGARCEAPLLPAYAPEFNPIKEGFSLPKAVLHKAGGRTINGLPGLGSKCADILQSIECGHSIEFWENEPG